MAGEPQDLNREQEEAQKLALAALETEFKAAEAELLKLINATAKLTDHNAKDLQVLAPETQKHFERIHQRLIKAVKREELSAGQAKRLAKNIAQQTQIAAQPFPLLVASEKHESYWAKLKIEKTKREQAINHIHNQNITLGARLGYGFFIALGVLVGAILGALMGFGLLWVTAKVLVAASVLQEIPTSQLSPVPIFYLASNTAAGTLSSIGAGIASVGIATGLGLGLGGIGGGYAAHLLWAKVKPVSEKLKDELTALNQEEMVFQSSKAIRNPIA